MKHLTISLLCAGLVALAACSKEKTLAPQTTAANSTEKGTISSSHLYKSPYKIFSRTLGNFGCGSRGGNCLDEVIVKPKTVEYTVMANIITAADNHDTAALSSIFTTYATQLETILYPEVITGVQNGTYSVINYHDSGSNTYYLEFINTPYEISVEVMPVTFSE